MRDFCEKWLVATPERWRDAVWKTSGENGKFSGENFKNTSQTQKIVKSTKSLKIQEELNGIFQLKRFLKNWKLAILRMFYTMKVFRMWEFWKIKVHFVCSNFFLAFQRGMKYFMGESTILKIFTGVAKSHGQFQAPLKYQKGIWAV